MAKTLHRLIYASRMTPEVAKDFQAQINDRLRASIRRAAFDPSAPDSPSAFALLKAMAETHDQILSLQQARLLDERLTA